MAWAAIIAAGGAETGTFADAMGTQHKALAPIAGQPSLAHTLAALQKTSCQQVVVVGPEAIRDVARDVQFVAEGETAIENVALGITAMPQFDKFLLLPADSPAILGPDLERFMGRFDQGAAVSLTSKAEFVAAYPGVPVKAIRLAEGEALSGATYAMDRESFVRAQNEIAGFRERRKSPISMVFRFGIGNLLKYVAGRLSKGEAERTLANFLQISRVWIDLDGHPSMALDFDTAEEYKLVQQIMTSHAKN